MKSSSIARRLIVLALVTVFLATSIAFSAYALGPGPAATAMQTPDPPTNGKIVFVSYTEQSYPDIYTVNPDGTDLARLTNTEIFEQSPAFSPDGNKIAFSRDSGLYLMNWDGSNQTQLSATAFHTGGALKWSPDGTKIVFDTGYQDAGGQEIAVINADGTGLTRLTNEPGSQSNFVWSPDSTRIAYDSVDGDIHVINADGTGGVNLTNSPEHEIEVNWSPDGTKIAFTRILSNYTIFVMNPDGTGQTQLTSGATQDFDGAFSPDGTRIAFRSYRNGSFDPFVMNADGSNQTQVVDVDINISLPIEWSPDGTKLLFADSPDGISEMYVVGVDGSGLVNVSNHATAYDDSYDWQNATAVVTPTPTPTPPAANLMASAGLDLLAANGATVTHNVSAFNNGPDTAANVTYTIQLPPGATYNTATNPYGSCSASAPDAQGTLVTCTVGDIPLYESRLISHTAIVTGAPYEVLTFTSTVNSDTSDPYLDSNVVSVSVQIEGPPVPTPTPATGVNPLLAFETRRDGNSEIYSRRADGSAQVNLTNDPADDADFVWSPDGSKLAFSRLVDEGSNNRELFVMNADGSNPVQLTNSPDDQDSGPVWSPDGTKLLFTSQNNASSTRALWVTNADGTNQIRIGIAPYDYDTDPTWSPDGTKIAYARDYFDGVNPTERNIYTANADGTNRTRIGHIVGAHDTSPAWSADGTKINFVRAVGSAVDVYDMDLDGSNQRNLSNIGTVYGYPAPSRSADRSKIAFVSGITNTPTVYVMNADGSSQVSVFNTSYYVATLAWSPDASKLVIGTIFNVGQGAGIHVANADGSGSLHFGGDAEYNQDPDWSPDGTRIAFTTRRTGNGGIDIINADGTGRVDLTNDPAYYRHPKWQPAQTSLPTAANLMASAGLDLLAANGATVTHNVSAFNNGPDTAANVTYTIQLPPGATYNTATNPYGSCSASAPDAQGTLVTCTVGDIPLYESRLISHTAIVTGAPYEVLTFTSTISSDTSDPYLDSNVVSVSVQIEGPPVPTPTPATGVNPLLAFETRRDGNSEIYSRRADGSAQVNLTNDPADDADFVWSPDGSKLAFSRLVDEGSNNRELFVMNADGSNPVQLTNSPDDQDSGPVWSPDGTKLLFTSQNNASSTRALWVTNADGTNQIRIGIAPYDYDTDPTWSPDGTKIAYARDYFDGVNPTERNIYTANADGTNRTRIGHIVGAHDTSPAWSADGTKINFVRAVGSAVDVYDMDLDGSNQRNLSNIGTVYGYPAPSRSADRSKIAFVSGITNTPTVYVMNADGSSQVSVFNTSYYVATLAWSPDASKLVIGTIFNVGQGAGIHVANADGSGSVHFGGDAEYNQDPDWSPDGTRIAFTTRRTGNGGIDIINADGTGRVDLTNDPAYYRHPKWQPAQQGNTPAGLNVSVTQNGATVTFSNVTTAGNTTITPIDPNSLSGVPGEYVINANSLAFEITTTAAYTGPITIGFQVPGVNNPITFSTLRVLHGEPPPVPNFVDRTILAPDSPTHDFPARTIYARVTSLSPFVIAEKPPNQMTALGPAQIWVGLKNSDDVGTKFDLLAEVFKNGSLIGSGQVNSVNGGSSGFNNAKLNAINLALSGTPAFGPGTSLSIRLSVRVAATGHRSGTARLWFNDTAANSRFTATIGGVPNTYYLRKLNNNLVLTTATGSTPKVTIDVFVDRAVGGNPFKPFGTWAISF